MFMYFGRGPAGLIAALLMLGLAGLVIAGPRWCRGSRLAVAAAVWALYAAGDLIWYSRHGAPSFAESTALVLAILPAFALGTARTDAVALRNALRLERVTTFVLTGTIGVLLYPVLALFLLAVLAHQYI